MGSNSGGTHRARIVEVLAVLLLLVGAVGAGVYWGQSGFLARESPVVESSSPSASELPSSAQSASASVSGLAEARVVKEVQFPDVHSVSRSNAESVARIAVLSLATWDSARDTGYGEAVERTVPLFDSSLAKRVAEVPAEAVAWDEKVVEKKAFSAPHVMNYEIYSDFSNVVRSGGIQARDGRPVQFFQLAVRWDWMGQDGMYWAEKERVRIYELVMVQGSDGAWSVGSYAWRDELPQ
ncbi:hypothetical protein [Rothia sp. P4278]|uniref:hypothetical protein n=1 Tax=Rothia sp. P4278 TaxID=3402658 RepID=UPI003ADC0613